jgi:hypothetical protein
MWKWRAESPEQLPEPLDLPLSVRKFQVSFSRVSLFLEGGLRAAPLFGIS